VSYKNSDSSNSHSHLGAPNPAAPAPAPENYILSHFGHRNPEPEIEVYARIRLLEGRVIDRLPPQLELGQYETLVRENLNHAYSIQDYLAALSNDIFDITVLELKANVIDRLSELLLSEPDDRLDRILRDSPFPQGVLKREALEFLEKELLAINLAEPRFQHEKVLTEQTLRYGLQNLQELGSLSPLYTGFIAHWRDGG
jgi:hypothetical protein